MKKAVRIVDVGPRDGLQNEKKTLTPGQRLKIIDTLVLAGVSSIEIGAFVSPKWVPQMKGSHLVARAALKKYSKYSKFGPRVSHRFSALVPNLRGLERALECRVPEVAVFGACSETFSQKNINCSIAESFVRFEEVAKKAKAKGVRLRAYLSTAFGCPYEGVVSQTQVVNLVKKMSKLGIYEISIGDTIGCAHPKQVQKLVLALEKVISLRKVAMHFHDTRGTGLVNSLAAYELGIRVFDTSFGGLGGCPYAQGASGNLATEDLVYLFESMGISTGIKLKPLIEARAQFSRLVGHELPSKVSQAGLPKNTQIF